MSDDLDPPESDPRPTDPRPTDPRLTDPQAARYVAAGWDFRRPVSRDIHTVRATSHWPRLPDDDRVHSADDEIRGAAGLLGVRIYRPHGRWRGTVLFLHGGGWAIGNLDTNDGLCRELAFRSGAQLISLDYRLAPEFPFPAALEDSVAALGALAAGAFDTDADLLAVAGHSAGGALAAAVARCSRDGLAAPVVHQTLLSPVLDADLDRPSYSECLADLPLTRDDMVWYWDLYLADPAGRSDPDASPLRIDDATGLPPATIIAAAVDPLRDEAIAYGTRLSDAGVPVTTVVQPGVPHLFLTFPPMPSRDACLELAGAELRAAFG